jgi:hypothetical protein
MLKYEDPCSRAIEKQAERELAAFLHAATEVIGQSNLKQAGDAWLHAMESLHWHAGSYEKFFRRVTILATAQLLATTVRSIPGRHGSTVSYLSESSQMMIPEVAT